jgi:hypothetical protein
MALRPLRAQMKIPSPTNGADSRAYAVACHLAQAGRRRTLYTESRFVISRSRLEPQRSSGFQRERNPKRGIERPQTL